VLKDRKAGRAASMRSRAWILFEDVGEREVCISGKRALSFNFRVLARTLNRLELGLNESVIDQE